MAPLLLFVVVFLLAGRLARARHGRASDAVDVGPTPRCVACGYDLRATPARCPECGTLVPRHRRALDAARLRDDWPTTPVEPRVPGLGEPLVRLWDAPHGMAANLLVEQLRARGVRAVVQRNVGPMQVGQYVAPAASFAVSVFAQDAELANEALERFAS